VVAHYVFVDVMSDKGVIPGIAPVLAALSMLGAGWALRDKQYGKAFVAVALTIVFSVITFFWMLYPNVMISSTDSAYNLTVTNASASDKTLQVMTIVALILVFAIGGMSFDFGGVAFSGIGLGAITGIVLNLILPKGRPSDEPDLEEAIPPMETEL